MSTRDTWPIRIIFSFYANTKYLVDSIRREGVADLNSIALTLLDHLMRGVKRTVLILITESMRKQHFSRVDNCSHVYTLRTNGIVMRFVCDFFSIPASFVAQLLMRYQRNLFAYFCFHTADSAPLIYKQELKLL